MNENEPKVYDKFNIRKLDNVDFFNYIKKQDIINVSMLYYFVIKRFDYKFSVLDIGCGKCRDLQFFEFMNCDALGIETIKNKNENLRFFNVELLDKLNNFEINKKFDLLWANTTFIIFNCYELIENLRKFSKYLKKQGYFFLNFYLGNGPKIIKNKYYLDINLELMRNICSIVPGLFILDYLEFRGEADERDDNIWVNFLLRKY
ncbi:MAG: class I SAM-dependent methyltransferase [Candidatus Dojkabacteria bacterium]|nr:class I SAM-dependent methyltransferase [Candidatus Dojkabacteria bacterium]